MAFSEIFELNTYYKKRFENKKDNICWCPEKEQPFFLCKTELKALGYDVENLPKSEYWTNTNRVGAMFYTVYFYDVRKCKKLKEPKTLVHECPRCGSKKMVNYSKRYSGAFSNVPDGKIKLKFICPNCFCSDEKLIDKN